MTCGRNSSAQIQRTTCQPRSRSASSRSFSRMTASSMVSSLRPQALILQPAVELAERAELRPGEVRTSRRTRSRSSNTSNCGSGAGRPSSWQRTRLNDSPTLSLRASRKACDPSRLGRRPPTDRLDPTRQRARPGRGQGAELDRRPQPLDRSGKVRARSATVRASEVTAMPSITVTSRSGAARHRGRGPTDRRTPPPLRSRRDVYPLDGAGKDR